ncbi:oligoendopeptidase F [Mesomycoplasma molare]|uniref:Oligopeptidase F n=1 Tax=Mesomycoplasma molare TaxID=171288 RepID=A0ABY5TUD8_9BACT|nr:oligoendopeptidase F [Mesomycoplasma molare]UWD33944.1 oligoendopeptidase F [Mesomycoplasma molare]
MKQYKNYKEVPDKYKFDLEFILKNKTVEEWLNDFEAYSQKVISQKAKRFQDIENFILYADLRKDFNLYFNQIYNYLSNKNNINLIDVETSKNFALLMTKYNDFIKNLGSEENDFFANIEKINQWKSDKRLKNHWKEIESILQREHHKLDDKIENYISETKKGDVSLYSTFAILRDSETKFKNIVDKNNKNIVLNTSNYLKLLKNKDENIRKQAQRNFLDGYLAHKQTFSSLLEQHLRNKSVLASTRKFNSLVEKEIFEDKIPVDFLNTLFSNVQSNADIYDKFLDLRKKFFKLKYKKNYKPWDSALSLVDVKEKYSIEEAQDLLFKAITPLGEKYLNKVKEAIEEKWVDYIHVENKRGGAYSIGAHYSVDKKYILMNFDGTLNSVATLAHEIGHSMHSWYSDSNQPFELASYPIFLAEIASIFNELMLFDYMYSNTKDKKMKFYLLEKSIQDFMSTVVKQCQWANYEFEIYKNIDNSIPMKTFESFEKVYVSVLQKYTNKKNKEKIGQKSNVYAVMVPHFYYNFYVYKYSVGYIVANIFFQKYKENGINELEKYIQNFLSTGAKDWPLEILKDSGIDLLNTDTIQKAFKLLRDKVKLYENLGKTIFKK